VILWYAGMALAIVWNVFRDPAVDHRLVVAGALVPDAIDVLAGHPAFFHALVAPVTALTLVMLTTRGRRVTRRRLLALPIGMFIHLVLDGTWTRGEVLWWPFLGSSFPDGSLWPRLGLALVEEVAGGLALWWFVRRFGLTDPARRRTFLRTGRLVVATP
ncbi:MAG: hypothetical protein ACRDYV_15780, partial [Acidimicrobiia bacterium]